jgi:hypothetical protein
MSGQYEILVKRLTEAVLDGPGVLESGTRKAIEAHSANFSGRQGGKIDEVPPLLRSFIEKVALNAYKVTDQDVQDLRQAGNSEDAIFEIIVSAALGAGRYRLEQGLSALQGGE